MKKLIEDNYKSIVARGLITPDTSTQDFINKLYEELNETESVCVVHYNAIDHMDFIDINQNDLGFEIADMILTALNFSYHYQLDIEHYLKEKIQINFDRAKNNK